MKYFIVFILLSFIEGVFDKNDYITFSPTGELIHKDIYPLALPVTSEKSARSAKNGREVGDKKTAIKQAILEVGPKVLIYNINKGNLELTVYDEEEARKLIEKFRELGFIGNSDEKEKTNKNTKRKKRHVKNNEDKQEPHNPKKKSKKRPYKITLMKNKQKK